MIASAQAVSRNNFQGASLILFEIYFGPKYLEKLKLIIGNNL
jgi:hypothetical protein